MTLCIRLPESLEAFAMRYDGYIVRLDYRKLYPPGKPKGVKVRVVVFIPEPQYKGKQVAPTVAEYRKALPTYPVYLWIWGDYNEDTLQDYINPKRFLS